MTPSTRSLALLTLALLISSSASPGFAEEDSETSATAELWAEVQGLYERARDAGEQVPKDVYEWVRRDVQSVGDWEYKVVEAAGSPADAVEQLLNTLGADRWECIWIQPAGSKLRLILKRPARTYLTQIPLSRLLKLVPAGGDGGGG